MLRIGLISDTHGLLRPEALAFLAGCDRIVHAGDVCDAAVLERLATIAPVTAVRGNNDLGDWARAVPEATSFTVDGVAVHVIHDVADLARWPAPPGTRVVIHGHSHKPTIVDRDGVLFVNPGSAGPRRFRLPISAAELIVDGGRIVATAPTTLVPPG